MNSVGDCAPSCGCCQRTRASAPTMRVVPGIDLGLVMHAELAPR